MEKDIRLKRKVVFETSSDELNGVFHRKFLTKTESKHNDEHYDIDVYTDSYTRSDAMDIPIEDMKALIQKAEDAGANFIQIDWHCDHQEYDIYGSHITRLSGDELYKTIANEKAKKNAEKQARIKRLEDEIKSLKNNYE